MGWMPAECAAMVVTIERINGSYARISEITAVIEGIALRTGILALNATVAAFTLPM